MMKKITLPSVIALLILGAGCTQNEIEIRNIAEGAVIFLFRGEQDSIPPNATKTLGEEDPIPNGTFAYSTTFNVPDRFTTSVADEELAGELLFQRNQTKHVLIYSSSWTEDSAGLIYEIHCNRSSNDPSSGP